ncbi:MAG: cation:proton antiporter [Betaproteobacteria bacterium]|nr:cation:proton antiporter [Betaproteobacteria bacterium]
MSELFFLPSWPPAAEAIPWYALLLLVAAIAGEVVHRWLHLPRLLGWIAAGLVLGPHVSGLLDAKALAGLRVVLDVALGVVLFQLGQRVDLGWLRRNPWLLATSVLESALAFGAMFVVLLLLDVRPLLAALAAAIGIATGPAVVLSLTRELRAQGQVTERMLLLTSLNCVYAFVAVSMLLAWLHQEYSDQWLTIVTHPLYLIFGSLILALVFALVTLGLLAVLGRREDAQFISVIALVVAAVYAASMLKLSVVLVLLGYGVMARAFDARRRFASLAFGRIGQILFILLFAITAATLDIDLLPVGALAGAALVAARYAGKALGVFALAPVSGLSVRKASLLSLGLMPMSGVALVLMQDTAALFPKLGPELAAVMVSAIVMVELLGPAVAYFALVRAGETDEPGGA